MKKLTFLLIPILSIGLISSASEKESMKVEYEVECSSCDVSYKNESGETVNYDGHSGKWSYSFEGVEGQFIYLAARSFSKEKVLVKIVKNGVTIRIAESELTEGFASIGDTL